LNDIIPFSFQGAKVRTLMIDGEPWWIASDVSSVLGYRMASDATRMLDEDEKGTHQMRTPGGDQNITVVNESGLYSLILRSRLDTAKAFKRWVTREVLPAIRRTGSYNAAPALPDLTTPQGVLALAEQFKQTAEQLVEADARIKELEPKALVHDTLMAAQDGDRLVRQAAKDIGWRETDLRGFLLDEKLIYRRQRTCGGWEYDFYAAHRDCFNAVEKVVEHTWGSCAHYTLHITPRGLSFVQMRISKRQSEMRAAIEGGAR
jgi:prophage antirepressor-like protein